MRGRLFGEGWLGDIGFLGEVFWLFWILLLRWVYVGVLGRVLSFLILRFDFFLFFGIEVIFVGLVKFLFVYFKYLGFWVFLF